MVKVEVHPRINERHPEIFVKDVRDAWENCLSSGCRKRSAFDDYVLVGTDARGRLLEMVAVQKGNGHWLVYHAMTPPSKRVLKELGLTGEGRLR